jgi:hypothetical protein
MPAIDISRASPLFSKAMCRDRYDIILSYPELTKEDIDL